MFIHWVLFRIKAKDVPVYAADCRLWGKKAKSHRGLLAWHTFRRVDKKGQYASCYLWKTHKDHTRFMAKHHDRLVSLSKCPVEVLGYYNFETL